MNGGMIGETTQLRPATKKYVRKKLRLGLQRKIWNSVEEMQLKLADKIGNIFTYYITYKG